MTFEPNLSREIFRMRSFLTKISFSPDNSLQLSDPRRPVNRTVGTLWTFMMIESISEIQYTRGRKHGLFPTSYLWGNPSPAVLSKSPPMVIDIQLVCVYVIEIHLYVKHFK